VSDASAQPPLAYGFTTILESSAHGWFGGYLVLSPLGRPLEFRCSTPVRPTRAQQILYGPTLKSYLLGEVIGRALLNGSAIEVAAILTDEPAMLELGTLRAEPVLLVTSRDDQSKEPTPGASEAAIEFNDYKIKAYPDCMPPVDRIHLLLAQLAQNVDLCEPFDRIRAALAEAQLATEAEGDDGTATAA
jgi:hypothetical protein